MRSIGRLTRQYRNSLQPSARFYCKRSLIIFGVSGRSLHDASKRPTNNKSEKERNSTLTSSGDWIPMAMKFGPPTDLLFSDNRKRQSMDSASAIEVPWGSSLKRL